MAKTINFGIDLGTTNSSIAKYTNGIVEVFKNPLNLKQTLPSVVSFKGDRIIVGDKAKEVLQKSPVNVFGTFKRKMGTSDKYFVDAISEFISPIELSTVVLKELKNFIHTGETIESAVITIPSAFDTTQSNATKKAGYSAGFNEVVLLQEPIAASLAFANKGGENFEEGKWLVYDFGGGTFDVALTSASEGEMKILDHEGDNFLGGSDFDRTIIDKFIIPKLKQLGEFGNLESDLKKASGKLNRLYNKLLYIAEDCKIELTNQSGSYIEFEVEDDNGKEIEFYEELTKTEFDSIIRPFVEKTIEMIRSILERNQLSNSDLNCILLIGGTTYIPLVRTVLSDAFQIKVDSSMDPSTAVVVGAAYYAGQKPRSRRITSTQSVKSAIELKLAYERTAQTDSALILAQIKDLPSGYTYRVSRSDQGYDSGKSPLTSLVKLNLPLVTGSFNLFSFQIYDDLGNKVQSEDIGITHGKFAIDGQPLPHNICLEVDSEDDNTTFLEPVFKKGDILPLKKTVIKQVSKTIYKGSENSISIKVIEGDIDSLPSANKLIGLIEIKGENLERDLIKGSDVELTFEITESRDVKVDTFLSLTDQEYNNIFSPSEMSISNKELIKEIGYFNRNLFAKQKWYEKNSHFEKAAEVVKLLDELNELETKIHYLDEEDTSDEKYKLDAEKRDFAKRIHKFYNSSYLTTIIEKYYKVKSNAFSWLSQSDNESDKGQLDKIIENENEFLRNGNIAIIKIKTTQLENFNLKISSRQTLTTEDYIYYFEYYKSLPYEKQDEANGFIQQGNELVMNEKYNQLGGVINGLAKLQKDEEKNNTDLFRNEGTGLK